MFDSARDGGGGGSSESLLLGKNSSSSSMVEGVVDYKKRRVINRNKFGRWRSAGLLIGVQIAEGFAFCGISSNLITYLTVSLGKSTTSAVEIVNVWSGVASMLPLVGAFVADSYLGRYRTILISCLLYLLGLSLLSLSAILPSKGPESWNNNEKITSPSPSSSPLQLIIFFSSLYIVAIAQGGFKPCVQAFAADQFDKRDKEERKSKSSFFNLYCFALCSADTASVLIMNYIEENLSWGLSFATSFISMGVGLVCLLLGTKTYRYSLEEDKINPILRIGQVFVATAKNWRIETPCILEDVEEDGEADEHLKFLNKALIPNGLQTSQTISLSQVEEAKTVLRLVPIWSCCLIYGILAAQPSTFFVKQGDTMDRSITPTFKIPSASLQSFIGISLLFSVLIYDRVLVPIARIFTGEPSGLTTLQRIGCGIVLSEITILIAAIVEKRRLQIALELGLVDMPNATIPMSIWWLVPQYVLCGLTDVFFMVGMQEFFYDQVPDGLRSIGLALYLSILGVGSLLSGIIVSILDKVTSTTCQYSWFSNNLNRAHLDFFYWFLAGLTIAEFVAYLYFSRLYVYNRKYLE